MCNLNFLLIISSVIVQAKCVGERENGFERKRFDIGLETCIENFDVHVNKIIRTQDSRAMGAKYLNEAEVNSRDECMKLCCETPTCDVFVFEQKNQTYVGFLSLELQDAKLSSLKARRLKLTPTKVPGSCYLFHCGSPEDFKCKFTQHRNYTSAVLALNNRLSELENRMKLTKHEEELSMLRKMDLSLETTTFLPISTKVPAIPVQTKQNATKSQCSRYQFECRGSGECIAIYNACDGIPQCADGSDEAPELYCPYITGTSHPKTFHEQLKNLKGKNDDPPQVEKIPEILASPEPLRKAQQPLNKSPTPPRQHQSISSMGYFPNGYSQQNDQTAEATRVKVEQSQQLPNQPRYYGREGEIVQYPLGNVQWQGYQPQTQEERNHFFSRKGNGLVPDTSDRYTDRYKQYLNNKYRHGQYPVPYSSELNHAEYLKYAAAAAAANNGYYSGSGPVFYPGSNNWPQRIPQQMHGLEDVPQRPLLSMYGNGMSGSAPSDYYYEDPQIKGRFPLPPQDPRTPQNPDSQQKNIPTKHFEKQETFQEPAKTEEPKKSESVKKNLENITSTSIKTSLKAETTTTANLKEQKSVRGVAERLKMSEEEEDGVNERPSGAILSLTLGMCITAIMVTLVGCRLRVVRKRMRRNSKSPYAHDADFLVNGMYL